jgi:hypothetical protein
LHVVWYAVQLWDETDVTDVRFDSAARTISFYTLHLGALACIQDTCVADPSLPRAFRSTVGAVG